jgi:P-type Mg2+ transporter
MDEDYLIVLRRWDISNIIKFMLLFGPISSIFDYVTYLHIIRTGKGPFFEGLAGPALIATSVVIAWSAFALPFTLIGGCLGFVPPPSLYWPIVVVIIGCYAVLTHVAKGSSGDGECRCGDGVSFGAIAARRGRAHGRST